MELNYKEFGQGDPIIILHGLFGTLDNWQTIAKQLAKDYMVYIIDQRNHGRSPHSPDFNYQLMAEDLAEFMEARWIYKAHLIGHSMGGKTAMQFALNYGDLVDKLTVVDIGPQQYDGRHQTIFEALLSIDIEKIESRQQAESLLSSRIDDAGVRQFLLKNLSRQKEGGYRWKMNLPVLYKEYDRVFEAVSGDPSFEGETLFIRGGRSDYIQDADIPAIQSIFPKARVETVVDAGHWVHAEQPKELLQLLQSFLSAE